VADESEERVKVGDLILVFTGYGIRTPHEVPSFMRGAPPMLETVAEGIESGESFIWYEEFLEKALAQGLLKSKDSAEAIRTLRHAAARIRAAQQH
jgi:hypothetical protein